MATKAVWISVVCAMLSSAIALPAHGQAQSIYILDPDNNEIEIRCY